MKKFLFLTLIFLGFCLSAQNFTLGQQILKNVKYQSPSRNYYLIFQNDGNLVLYNKRNNMSLWDSKTGNQGASAQFQSDGNLVVYNNSNRAVFSTNTGNRGQTLKIQDDGNLVVYGGRNNPVWSSIADRDQNGDVSGSNTKTISKVYNFVRGQKIYSENRRYYLIFQTDGNLVLYNNARNILWDSKTHNIGVGAQFQADGNLTVYDRNGSAAYSTNTNLRDGNSLMIQNDGNLVIYDSSNNPVWASGQVK